MRRSELDRSMKVVLVSDQSSTDAALRSVVRTTSGHQLHRCLTLDELDAALIEEAQLVLVDELLGGPCSELYLRVLDRLSDEGAASRTFVLGGANFKTAHAASKARVAGYLLKGELVEEIRPLLDERAPAADASSARGDGMVGASPALDKLRRLIDRFARSPRPVLVRGETGTGKELVVRALHARGPHAQAPFLDLNCGALPEQLVESQLFGHRRGAFTGAAETTPGVLESVGRGTLFLDEIGEMPLALQAKLLRVLETGMYRMVGCNKPRRFEGRVIAATHADLDAMVQAGSFREDLYHRICVLELLVPPLEARREDIPSLARHFASLQDPPRRFTSEAIELLARAPWPGNIRQLRNIVDRICVMSDEACLGVADVSPFAPKRRLSQERKIEDDALSRFADSIMLLDVEDKLSAVQDLLIAESLRRSGGNKSAAARSLGVHRKVLERRLGKNGRSNPLD